MKHKKKIKADIKQILADSGVDKHLWEKCLARLVNYTDKVRTEPLVVGNSEEVGG